MTTQSECHTSLRGNYQRLIGFLTLLFSLYTTDIYSIQAEIITSLSKPTISFQFIWVRNQNFKITVFEIDCKAVFCFIAFLGYVSLKNVTTHVPVKHFLFVKSVFFWKKAISLKIKLHILSLLICTATDVNESWFRLAFLGTTKIHGALGEGS